MTAPTKDISRRLSSLARPASLQSVRRRNKDTAQEVCQLRKYRAAAGHAKMRIVIRTAARLAVWSAWEDRKFEQRLRFHGFMPQVERVRARLKKGGPRHVIFLGRKDVS